MENPLIRIVWHLIKRSAPVLLGILIIAGLVVKIGIDKLLSALSTIDISILLVSLLLLSIAILIKSLRWHLLLIPIGLRDIQLSMYTYFAGQVTNQILPTGSGEIVRITILRNRITATAIRIVPALLIERLSDTMLLLLFTLIFSAIYLNIALVLLFAIILLISITILIRPSLLESIGQILDKVIMTAGWKNNLLYTVIKKLSELTKSIEFYSKNKGVILQTLLLTLLPWTIFEVSSQYFLINSTGYHITYLEMLGVIAVSWIIGTVSMLPGGLGTMEVTYALGLSTFGVPFETGLSMALIYRAFIYLLFGLFSGVVFSMNSMSLRMHSQVPVIKK